MQHLVDAAANSLDAVTSVVLQPARGVLDEVGAMPAEREPTRSRDAPTADVAGHLGH
jgi:hypothetical protein